MYDLIIVGAGAAGSMAALMCEKSNIKVLLCDCNQIIGRKLLSTGNGRCNFTNTNLNSNFYYSDNDEFVESIISEFDDKDIISFFRDLGIYSKEIDSYVYPITNSAASVQKVVADKILNSTNIKFLSDNVVDIKKDTDFTVVFSESGQIKSKKILLATGGLAKASLGNNKNGYKIAKRLGHTINDPLPALVHLKTNSPLLKGLAKQRVYAKVTLVKDENLTSYSDIGEVQFNKDNISGIPVMNISSPAAVILNNKSDLKLSVDFVPFLTDEELAKELKLRIQANRSIEGIIPEKTIDALGLRILNITKIDTYVKCLKNMIFDISATGTFEDAQVTKGGILLSEIKGNLESKFVDNLYFAGEILDVDARCGGYNLTFAFACAKRAIDSILK